MIKRLFVIIAFLAFVFFVTASNEPVMAPPDPPPGTGTGSSVDPEPLPVILGIMTSDSDFSESNTFIPVFT
ncbi:MAG: hypothetical protein ACFFD4_18390 [Candidatus Odinarchaeota archaeon]